MAGSNFNDTNKLAIAELDIAPLSAIYMPGLAANPFAGGTYGFYIGTDTELYYYDGTHTAFKLTNNGAAAGGAGSPLTATNIWVGNGSNVAAAVAMSGQATMNNAGSVTLDNASVIAKLLTAYSAAPGTIAGTDSIIAAIQKADGNAYVGLHGYLTTATTGGTLTLDVNSAYQQYFTGATTHTVVLPVVATLTLGRQFQIVNNSTGNVTVNSSGGNLVATVAGGGAVVAVTCILLSGTTAASWSVSYLVGLDFSTALKIQPFADATYTLGDSTKNFKALYLDDGVSTGGRVNFNASTTTFLGSSASGASLLFGGAVNVAPNTNRGAHLGQAGDSWTYVSLDNDVTDGGAIYFDDTTTSFLKSSTDGLVLYVGGFTYFRPIVDATTSLGYTSYNWKGLYLDNGVTDGGAVFFNNSTTSFLKSTADGLTLNVGGFTSVLPNADVTTALGSSSKNFKWLNLDNSTTDGGAIFFNASTTSFLKSAADGATLDIGGFTIVQPNADVTTALGASTKNFKSLNLDNGVTDGGAVYFNASTTAFLKSTADGLTMDIGGFTLVEPAVDATTALGAAGKSFKSLQLDNGVTDGGAVYFNTATTAFLKSTADGATLNVGGFTAVNPAATNTTSLGSSTYRFKDLATSGARYVGRVDASLAAAIAVANELRTDIISHFANATRHTTGQQSTGTMPVAATDLTSLIALITEELVLYDAHNADAILGVGWAYHDAQATDEALASATAPTTLAECVTRLRDMKAKYNLHEALTTGHATQASVPADQVATDLESYTTTSSDYIVGTSNASAAFNVVLATASIVDGRTIIIKDTSGGAGTYNITVSTEGAELIDGAASVVIGVAYGAVKVFSDGTNWFTI